MIFNWHFVFFFILATSGSEVSDPLNDESRSFEFSAFPVFGPPELHRHLEAVTESRLARLHSRNITIASAYSYSTQSLNHFECTDQTHFPVSAKFVDVKLSSLAVMLLHSSVNCKNFMLEAEAFLNALMDKKTWKKSYSCELSQEIVLFMPHVLDAFSIAIANARPATAKRVLLYIFTEPHLIDSIRNVTVLCAFPDYSFLSYDQIKTLFVNANSGGTMLLSQVPSALATIPTKLILDILSLPEVNWCFNATFCAALLDARKGKKNEKFLLEMMQDLRSWPLLQYCRVSKGKIVLQDKAFCSYCFDCNWPLGERKYFNTKHLEPIKDAGEFVLAAFRFLVACERHLHNRLIKADPVAEDICWLLHQRKHLNELAFGLIESSPELDHFRNLLGTPLSAVLRILIREHDPFLQQFTEELAAVYFDQELSPERICTALIALTTSNELVLVSVYIRNAMFLLIHVFYPDVESDFDTPCPSLDLNSIADVGNCELDIPQTFRDVFLYILIQNAADHLDPEPSAVECCYLAELLQNHHYQSVFEQMRANLTFTSLTRFLELEVVTFRDIWLNSLASLGSLDTTSRAPASWQLICNDMVLCVYLGGFRLAISVFDADTLLNHFLPHLAQNSIVVSSFYRYHVPHIFSEPHLRVMSESEAGVGFLNSPTGSAMLMNQVTLRGINYNILEKDCLLALGKSLLSLPTWPVDFTVKVLNQSDNLLHFPDRFTVLVNPKFLNNPQLQAAAWEIPTFNSLLKLEKCEPYITLLSSHMDSLIRTLKCKTSAKWDSEDEARLLWSVLKWAILQELHFIRWQLIHNQYNTILQDVSVRWTNLETAGHIYGLLAGDERRIRAQFYSACQSSCEKIQRKLSPCGWQILRSLMDTARPALCPARQSFMQYHLKNAEILPGLSKLVELSQDQLIEQQLRDQAWSFKSTFSMGPETLPADLQELVAKLAPSDKVQCVWATRAQLLNATNYDHLLFINPNFPGFSSIHDLLQLPHRNLLPLDDLVLMYELFQ